ncbi:MAG: metal-dependent transcriptional regulator [Candidatus Hadarchaeota archaeon]
MPHMICHTPRSTLPAITYSEEEYLESIYTLGKGKNIVKVKELAKSLRVKDPSVVEMLRKLKSRGFVSYDRPGVKLTPKGQRHAVKVVRRHELAERLLADVFGYPLPKVHDMACRFEHVMDDDLTERIDKMLGEPKTCPHGSLIPTQKGTVQSNKTTQLTEAPKGEKCTVMKIPEDRAEVERLLALNVIPGSKVSVVERLPRGATVLLCGDTKVALSRNIASQIRVRMRHRHRGR